AVPEVPVGPRLKYRRALPRPGTVRRPGNRLGHHEYVVAVDDFGWHRVGRGSVGRRAAELRAGIAQFPRQITAASPWLTELERRVASRLATKPTLITYPMRDTG